MIYLVMNNLKKLIQVLNAEDKVILAGNQAEVKSYYLKSKIFAFTSNSEGFPNVIGEAQSAGLPVISFDCVAGPSEMIKDGNNGFLIPLFDYDMFKLKLKLLMDDSSLRERFGKKGKEAIKKYSVNVIGEQYYKFILGDN